MTLHTLTLPDDPAELPGWLERQLLSPDFGRFLAELQALFPATPGTDPPRHLLDRWISVVLTDGLQPVPPDVLRRLLRHPPLLAELQERIAINGGGYWDAVSDRSDDLRDPFERGKRALERVFAPDAVASAPDRPKVAPPAVPKAGARQSSRGYKLLAFVSTGIAACLAFAVGFLAVRGPDEPPIPKAQIAWGWGKPGGVAAEQSTPKDYLKKLAANAEEWTLHRPSDPTGLGIRIAEFRTGCTRLMHSAYGPLAPADRAWLLEQCRAWAKELDGHQQALDGGADPLAVRAGVDETAGAIAAALRERAKGVR